MRHIKILIEGEPRSGKTTLAALIRHFLIKRQHEINYVAQTKSMANRFSLAKVELINAIDDNHKLDQEPMLVEIHERDTLSSTNLLPSHIKQPRTRAEAEALLSEAEVMLSLANNFLKHNKV